MAPSPSRCSPKHHYGLGIALAFLLAVDMVAAGIFNDVQVIWGEKRNYYFMDGDSPVLAMSLDKYEGSGFKSKQMYLYARIDVDIQLIEGHSAGTVSTIYVRSTPPPIHR